MLVVFCGKKRSGKDTCAQYLINNYGFKPCRKLAAPIKEIGKIMFGWTDEMTEGIDYDREQIIPELGLSVRQFLQETGSLFKYNLSEILPEYGRQTGDRVWVKILVNWLREQNPEGNYVLSDMRFPEEAAELKKEFPDTIIVKLVSDRSPEDEHISEILIDAIPVDWTIKNDSSIEDLKYFVDAIMKEYYIG